MPPAGGIVVSGAGDRPFALVGDAMGR